jgi:hypothetical protein
MEAGMGSIGAKRARQTTDQRSGALRPYVRHSGQTITTFNGVSYFQVDSAARVSGEASDQMIALLPAMLAVDLVQMTSE